MTKRIGLFQISLTITSFLYCEPECDATLRAIQPNQSNKACANNPINPQTQHSVSQAAVARGAGSTPTRSLLRMSSIS